MRRSSPRRIMKRRRCSSTGSINPRASGKRRIHAIRSWSTASRFCRRGSSLAPRCEKRSPQGEPNDSVSRSGNSLTRQLADAAALIGKQEMLAAASERKDDRLLRRALEKAAESCGEPTPSSAPRNSEQLPAKRAEVLRRVCKKTTPPAPVPQTLRAILQRSGYLQRPSEGSAGSKRQASSSTSV